MSLTMMIVVAVIAVIVNALLIFLLLGMFDVVTEEELKEQLKKVHRSLLAELADVTEQVTEVRKSVQTLDNRGHRKRLEGLLGNLEELFRDEHLERLRADLATAGSLRDDARADRKAWQAAIQQLRDDDRADREHFQRQMEALQRQVLRCKEGKESE